MPPNITQVIKLANSEHGVKPIQLKLKVRFHSHAFSIEPLYRGQHTHRDRLRDRHRGSESETDTHTHRESVPLIAVHCTAGVVVNKWPKLRRVDHGQ
jgi:hypothetical protein